MNDVNNSVTYRKVALTTVDNPYCPITDFRNWFVFDMQKGYNTSAYLARVEHTADSLSLSEKMRAKEEAIDEILKYDIFNQYKKVEKIVTEQI